MQSTPKTPESQVFSPDDLIEYWPVEAEQVYRVQLPDGEPITIPYYLICEKVDLEEGEALHWLSPITREDVDREKIYRFRYTMSIKTRDEIFCEILNEMSLNRAA